MTASVALGGWTLAPRVIRPFALDPASELRYEEELDKGLYRAATAALGERRGTIIVMDPQTGRVRAVVNPEVAFGEIFSPGSTIKPFTALAAMRSGLIDEESRTLCREKYSHEEFHTTCSHPRDLPPLGPAEAIAYSCNYYFGKLGERLAESSFDSTLAEFGFGQRTGINAGRESAGQLSREWESQSALGEGEHVEVTPIQLINAYSALVNGGHLFVPQLAQAKSFVPSLRANVAINDAQHTEILKGMRGAVRYGTAEPAKLYSLPLYVFGKTGTATEIKGFRTQGWFVGFASQIDEEANDASASSAKKIKLAVLVFLERAHGSQAAELSKSIFAEYARHAQRKEDGKTVGWGDGETGGQSYREVPPFAPSPLPPVTSGRIPPSPLPPVSSMLRVHLVREKLTRLMSLEDYVRGVVAAEGSVESEIEALKALAIASRTYALKNMGRHAEEGYDFCTTTHCQRYRLVETSPTSHVSPTVLEAMKETEGEVLRDSGGRLADSYFSASCGGATANIATLWGGPPTTYLQGVRDEYCLTMPHRSWTDMISTEQLVKALQSDPRTDVGSRVVDLKVARRDETGRVQLITIEGERQRSVSGWDFKIIVGRVLGWSVLKSSRFEISRSGTNFIFKGSGFGHGLGLCQEGAHVMATRGATYRQILAKYFPGTSVAKGERYLATAVELKVPDSFSADLLWNSRNDNQSSTNHDRFSRSTSRRGKLSGEHFHVNYPAKLSQAEVENLMRLLESSRRDLIARARAAGFSAEFPSLEIFINETTGDFVGRTGQSWWAAAATRGNQIELQPVELLKRRGVFETTLRHELAHTLIHVLGRGRTPRWLAEGLALHLAGEGKMLARDKTTLRITDEEIEQNFSQAKSAAEMKAAYAAAYSKVRRLINSEGEAAVWRRAVR